MIDGVECGAQIKGDQQTRFATIGCSVDVIQRMYQRCFRGVTLPIGGLKIVERRTACDMRLEQ